jgi:hypothetical protein
VKAIYLVRTAVVNLKNSLIAIELKGSIESNLPTPIDNGWREKGMEKSSPERIRLRRRQFFLTFHEETE